MPNINLEQVEASLKASRRRSQRRFLIFLILVLAIWGSTYIYTKGEFHLFTRKADTVIVDQKSAIDARDSLIAAQTSLIKLLQDSLQVVVAKIPHTTGRPLIRNYEAERIRQQILLQERERRRRDSILEARKLQLGKEYYNIDIQRSVQQSPPAPK